MYQYLNYSLLFILLLLIYNLILKIPGNKKEFVLACDSRYTKIVFTLMSKPITIYVRLIFINIRDLGLKKPLSGLFKVFLSGKKRLF